MKTSIAVTCVLIVSAVCWGADWLGEIQGGFGDTGNIKVASMAEFEGKLYAGTHNSAGCAIWERTALKGRSAWAVISSGGFGDTSNHVAGAMAVFTYDIGVLIKRLYVGTMNQAGGAEVWAFDGATWIQANSNGFGNPNNYLIQSLTVFGESLFAGVSNGTTGAEIWHFTGITWAQDVTGGFGDANTTAVTSLVVFDGKLYASTTNPNGGDIWESSDGSTWTRTVAEGYFSSALGNGIRSMGVAGGGLYASVFSNIAGTEIWKIRPGSPEMIGPAGLGDYRNTSASAMTSFHEELWLGTQNSTTGTEIWRLRGQTWTQENIDGFGDADSLATPTMTVFGGHLFTGVWNSTNGAEIWRLPLIFSDGFETGDVSGWSAAMP